MLTYIYATKLQGYNMALLPYLSSIRSLTLNRHYQAVITQRYTVYGIGIRYTICSPLHNLNLPAATLECRLWRRANRIIAYSEHRIPYIAPCDHGLTIQGNINFAFLLHSMDRYYMTYNTIRPIELKIQKIRISHQQDDASLILIHEIMCIEIHVQ